MNKKNRGKSHSHRGKKTFRGAKGGKFSPPKAGTSHVGSDVLSKTNEPSITVKDDIPQETNTPKRLMERDVGITEYISQHSGFGGIIKQRFSDFHVNEIDSDGNIVTLTTVVPPEPVGEAKEGKEQAEEYLKSVLPSDTFEKLKQLIESVGDDLEIEASGMTKDDRRKLHNALHAIGKHQLVSNTEDKDGKKLIKISKFKHNVKSDRRQAWPAERDGEYVYFVLHKENMDTMETVNYIASKFRLKSHMIGYAGTKDRRGKTSQLMSVWRIEPNKLASLNRGLRGVTLGNYSFRRKGLKLGDLRGNRFRIVLRNVTGTEDQIQEAMASLQENGFLNYYGLQRFGSCVSVPTYDVGKALLQGDWKQAVELILKPRDGEQNREMSEARKVWWETRDALKALKILRNKDKFIEGKLLHGLSHHGANNYITALENIPRNTRLLYLHSYQSLLWNRVVSRRISQFGLKPMVGDLVLVGDSKPEIVEDPTEDDSTTSTADTEESSTRKNMVKVLSESDLANVSISDIVLPLPGFDIVYPNNVVKEWFEELLLADGLSSAGLKQAVRKYSLSGAYRKILVHPTNVSWKTMRYTDPQTTLVLSDVEVMQKMEPPKDEPDGAYKALILDFCLPSSTYATMAMREVLKSDTSSLHQASLNDYNSVKGGDISKKCVVKEQTSSPETVHRWSQNGTMGDSGQSASQSATDGEAKQSQDLCDSQSSATGKEVSEETVEFTEVAPPTANTEHELTDSCPASPSEKQEISEPSADNLPTDKEPIEEKTKCSDSDVSETQKKQQEEVDTSCRIEGVAEKSEAINILSSAGNSINTKGLSESDETPASADETSATEVCGDNVKESTVSLEKKIKPEGLESSMKILPRCKDISVALISEELSSSRSDVKKSSGGESLNKWESFTSGPSTSQFISGSEQEIGNIKDAPPTDLKEGCKLKNLPSTKSIESDLTESEIASSLEDQPNDTKGRSLEIVSLAGNMNSKEENTLHDTSVKRKGDIGDTETCEYEAKRICLEQAVSKAENEQEIINETEELPDQNRTENIAEGQENKGREEKIDANNVEDGNEDESVRKRKVPEKEEFTSEIKKPKLSSGNTEGIGVSTDVKK